MIQEYLLLNEIEKEKIEAFDAKEATLKLAQIKGQDGWSVRYYLEGENENIARKLSEIDISFRAQFSATALESGCSTYMIRCLYPLVSDFERKLRKLLYITSAVHNDRAAVKNISNLESKNFGDIFSMLFIDGEFMSSVKGNIKSRQRELFSKADIVAYIESLDEETVWDTLLGKGTVPSLRTRFNDVREYRNDVMHSHNIDWEKYKDALELYTAINQELDSALADVIDNEKPAQENTFFNQTLQEALEAQTQFSAYSELQKQMQEFALPYMTNSEIEALRQQVKEATEVFRESSESLKLQEEWKGISASLIPPELHQSLTEAVKSVYSIKADIAPALTALQNTMSQLPKIEIPPAFIKLQQSLSSFPSLPDGYDEDAKKDSDETDHSSDNDGGKQ